MPMRPTFWHPGCAKCRLHRAEDDRRDHHLDQLDEAVTERLSIDLRPVRILPADEGAKPMAMRTWI